MGAALSKVIWTILWLIESFHGHNQSCKILSFLKGFRFEGRPKNGCLPLKAKSSLTQFSASALTVIKLFLYLFVIIIYYFV